MPETDSTIHQDPESTDGKPDAGNLEKQSEQSLIVVKSGVVFKGNDDFVVTKSAINLEKSGTLTKEKVSLLEKMLRPAILTGRTVLDISAHPGFFVYSAWQNGAAKATTVDSDAEFNERIAKAAKHLGAENITAERVDWQKSSAKCDVLLALDSSQWCKDGAGGANNARLAGTDGENSATLAGNADGANRANDSGDSGGSSGSSGAGGVTVIDGKVVERLVKKIASLTTYLALIQDVGAAPVGTGDGSGVAKNALTTAEFLQLLKRSFKRVECVGEADGKNLYACFQQHHEIDLRCPLPAFTGGGALISCRQLTEFAGLEYWSRVYDGDGVIYKQATRELIQRERAMLSRLKSRFFPQVLDIKDCGDSSVLVLEKIEGRSLEDSTSELTSSLGNFTMFALECLQILNELQIQGIEHRDIQAGNIIVRDGNPVLLDFGWAVSEDLPMFVPAGLLSVAEDLQVCDVYSMGKILAQLADGKYPELKSIFELMTEPDPVARVKSATDLSALLKLSAAAAANLPASAADLSMGSEQSALLTKLINNLKINRARLEASRNDFVALETKSKEDRDHRLAVLESEYDMVVTEINRVIGELHRVIKEKDDLLALLDERQKLIEGITQGQAWRLANKLQRSKKSFGSMFGKSP